MSFIFFLNGEYWIDEPRTIDREHKNKTHTNTTHTQKQQFTTWIATIGVIAFSIYWTSMRIYSKTPLYKDHLNGLYIGVVLLLS